MPISENDYSFNDSDSEAPTCSSSTSSMMSKAELRKTHKPIMEKRRRAKINTSLNEIKDLLLAALKKDPERHSKLEKADILEMAVKHLKTVQKQQKDIAIRSDPNLALKYKSGFLECATEVSSFVDQLDGIDTGLRHRLTNHLNKYANTIDRPQLNFASSTLLASFAAQSRFNAKGDDQNNNMHANATNTVELIPSCLPNGDFAFLLPKSSFTSILNSTNNAAGAVERPSAFVTVQPRAQLQLSPPISPESPPPPKIIKPKAVLQTFGDAEKIQSIKFPINRKESNSEPLCIITNNGERYRQAQKVEESCRKEENIFLGGMGGMKRKAMDDGLLALAPPQKHVKIDNMRRGILDSQMMSAFRVVANNKLHPQHNGEKNGGFAFGMRSKDAEEVPEQDNEKGDNMWRPW